MNMSWMVTSFIIWMAETQEFEESQLNCQELLGHTNEFTDTGKLRKGFIHFWRNFAYEEEGRPFIQVNHDVQMEGIGEVIHKEWKLFSPGIVLVVVSNIKSLSGCKNTSRLDDLLKGLVMAANTTRMWIVTHGANIGIAKAIGDAFHKALQLGQSSFCHKHLGQSMPVSTSYAVIGIIREDLVEYAEILNNLGRVEIENDGNLPEENKYELNPDHSHFIIVRDDTVAKRGIHHFLFRLEQYIIDTEKVTEMELEGEAETHDYKCQVEGSKVPVIALLVQGGYECVHIILQHLLNHCPVLVVQGSGGLADILAYATCIRVTHGRWNPEFVENFLKPQITSKIAEKFPDLDENTTASSIFRDRILECVQHAQQGQQTYLMILNTHSHLCDLTNLDEYILKALFQSQKPDAIKWYNQMEKNLYLSIDWNSPNVALNEVFRKDLTTKFKISKELFEQALFRSDRERFVSLFLNEGFQIHKYLTPKKLKNMFLRVQNQEFFQTVCWEGVLGYGMLSKRGQNFLEGDLNKLIQATTGFSKFVSSQRLSLNAAGMYVGSPATAERKALTLMTMWAIFANRTVLAEVLWRNSDQPIHLALVISNICSKLTNYISESTYKLKIMRTKRKFSEMATRILNISYKDASCRSFDVLSQESPDWSYKTAVELAAEGKNHTFLAHPCCQKWLTRLFYGNIHIKEHTWNAVKLPLCVKVLLCAFFIFPMYFWVKFKTNPNDIRASFVDDTTDSDEETDGMGKSKDSIHKHLKHKTSSPYIWSADVVGDHKRELPQKSINGVTVTHPSIFRMIYLMWSAPVTKLWTFQVFYIIYLGLFSIAVLWPSCGNFYLDVTVCVWTFLLVVEVIRRTYRLYMRYPSAPLLLKCCEILFIISFVILFSIGRIFHVGDIFDPYNERVLMCFGLLYFYYRLIAIYLPLSPTLGPLLYKVKLMVTVDFVNFMRMAILVIISCGVVIHAVIYPDFPLSSELFRRTFHRAWFSIFLAPIEDLEVQERCQSLRVSQKTTHSCFVGNYRDYTCPTTGVWPYVFSIQYFVLLKMILLTILYATFTARASKIDDKTVSIWKFQRYQLIVDFANRLRLPAPLNIFSYLIGIVKWMYGLCCMKCRQTSKKYDGSLFNENVAGYFNEEDNNYWKHLVQEYYKRQEKSIKEDDLSKKQLQLLTTIAEDIDYEKNMMIQVKGLIRELDRIMNQAKGFVEDFKKMSQKEVSVHQIFLHTLARKSPYPGTMVHRFPVPDKYVPWEVLWVEYEPVIYTRHYSEFPVSLQPFIDEDILYLIKTKGTIPVSKWNSLSTTVEGFLVDRQSWILNYDKTTLEYKLDEEGLPVNPFGRTGLQGKGTLPRWGPNHYIFVVITRWQKNKLVREEDKGLEFIAFTEDDLHEISLPGGLVSGENKYNGICGLFKTEAEGSFQWQNDEDMIQFFKSCGVTSQNLDSQTETRADVICDVIHRGYMDDPWNTDQAWREAEMWNIHFQNEEHITEKLPMNLNWILITDDIFLKLPDGEAMLLHKITENFRRIRH
ncbi:transient receptor potential cation channel subfamily M member 2-like [Limulus polyphemus]|uniref:Transient receptor potential cation channel subfamily M member 2-like n=1 Tax=Limulus polyphemus TaxID=6850 RepID=A0ABM1TEP4_LIMPO|nr:transient receptor potential cation channel subfamily M member 2-like [Limulus polyphemus]